MSNIKPTVSRLIYKFLLDYKDWCPSGRLEEQNFLNATGSTISRKARLLQNAKWIAVRYVNGNAEYRALRTQAERDAYEPQNDPETGVEDETEDMEPEAAKFTYEPVLGPSGRPVAMRAVKV